jgi:FAD/FMN-containing dehydrogenase
MRTKYRKTWKNHLGNQAIDPLRLCAPETLEEVVALVREAERCACTVRAVGSGHSWSDVALTPGFLLDTSHLCRPLDLEPALLRGSVNTATLVRAEAGIKLRQLNAYLDGRGLALTNMGGYDAQSVAGVISTSTHGSGIAFGPIADQMRSLDVVAGGGQVYRIERRAGPTDAAAFGARYPDRRLVQDDAWFDAAVVSMGCMGVIYAAILEVEPKYWLKEVRTLTTWSQIKADLRAGDVLRRNRHYEFIFNPYAVEGDHHCIVTTRNKTAEPVGKPKDKLERHPLTELLSSLPITAKILNLLFDWQPKLTPQSIDRALKSLRDDEYSNVSYKVFNIGAANKLPAYSMEIAVPLAGDAHIQAVERVMALAEERSRLGQVYETAPVAVRFVKGTDAHMSMMYQRDTAMLELIMMTDTEGGYELLGAYEEALSELGGRPHWGQVNYLTGSHDAVRSLYPRFDEWQGIRGQLDPRGTFVSPFTKRVGISRRGFLPG